MTRLKRTCVYHVKLKIIPNIKGYKTKFCSGVVYARTETEAGDLAVIRAQKTKWIADDKEEISVTAAVWNVVKLKCDFTAHFKDCEHGEVKKST